MSDVIFLDAETGPLPSERREFTKPDLEGFKQTCDQRWKAETVVTKFDEKLTSWEQGADAALKAITGEVLMVGYTFGDGIYHKFYQDDEVNEIMMLEAMWDLIKEPLTIINHYLLQFDLPFMIRRSLILGVLVPQWILADITQYRPKLLIDLNKFWQFGDRQTKIKLKYLCGAFGIKVKDSPVTGETFYEWFKKDREKAIEYNRQDVMCLPELWKRMHP